MQGGHDFVGDGGFFAGDAADDRVHLFAAKDLGVGAGAGQAVGGRRGAGDDKGGISGGEADVYVNVAAVDGVDVADQRHGQVGPLIALDASVGDGLEQGHGA